MQILPAPKDKTAMRIWIPPGAAAVVQILPAPPDSAAVMKSQNAPEISLLSDVTLI